MLLVYPVQPNMRGVKIARRSKYQKLTVNREKTEAAKTVATEYLRI